MIFILISISIEHYKISSEGVVDGCSDGEFASSPKQLFHIHSIKFQLHFHGYFAERRLQSIIKNTIIKDQIHIILILLLTFISIVREFAFDGPEIHRVLYDFRIVQ
jgi:hypothetical protein